MKKTQYPNERPVHVNMAKLDDLLEARNFLPSDVRVVFKLIEMMGDYNELAFSTASLADRTGLSTASVRRSLKKIRATGLLIENEYRITFNPEIAYKDYERAFFPLEHTIRHLFQ